MLNMRPLAAQRIYESPLSPARAAPRAPATNRAVLGAATNRAVLGRLAQSARMDFAVLALVRLGTRE